MTLMISESTLKSVTQYMGVLHGGLHLTPFVETVEYVIDVGCVQVSEEELEEYIARQRQAGHKLPGVTSSHPKPQVGFGVPARCAAHLHIHVQQPRIAFESTFDSCTPCMI